eukprot:CAMPEP_0194195356 /NCGR_PEP_ID=MMETSP0154-20130528/76091_1 /TAXON_ID=1049557 /ORGANISM="Thalassiothrix antarctica, Strain L6-D1" /LENGTH=649 /DNA_ID=CAMNT_0038919881 /DNA_START=537 /DNA_END=2483 /DNA_ORIENTATION=+
MTKLNAFLLLLPWMAPSSTVASDGKEPYEALCTSEVAFNADTTVIYECIGTDSQACEDAGGFYSEEDSVCDDINPFSSEECDAISGFSFSPSFTCQEVAPYASNIDCSNFLVTLVYLASIQSTCCGGTENHRNLCSDDQKPFEAFCTSEAEYDIDAILFYECRGTESQACEDAGGSYNAEESSCDDIDTFSSEECDAIPGFTFEPSATCQDLASFASALVDCNDIFSTSFLLSSRGTESQACEDAGGSYNAEGSSCDDINTFSSEECDAIPGFTSEPTVTCRDVAIIAPLIDCNDLSSTGFLLPLIQSTCCGGTENHLDLCPNTQKPYEGFCTSEADFNADTTVTYECKGTDSKACEEAGGSFDEEESVCDDLSPFSSEECDAIPKFTFTPSATCQEISFIASQIDCNDYLSSIYLPLVQSTCCGAPENYKDLCPGITSSDLITSNDVCIRCAAVMEGVTENCFDAVGLWQAQSGISVDFWSGCANIESPMDVNTECKQSVFEYHNCTEIFEETVNVIPTVSPTKTPAASPIVSPTKTPTVSPIVSPTKTPTVSPTVLSTKIPAVSPTTLPTTSPTATSTVSSTALPTKSQATLPTASPSSSSEATPTVVSPTDSQTENSTSLNTSLSSSFDALCPSIFIVVISLLFTW